LSKCFFYIVHWHFDQNGSPRLATNEILEKLGAKITIEQSGSGETVTIKLKDCRDAHQTLGVQAIPMCDMKAEGTHSAKKSRNIATNAASAPLSKSEGWSFYRSKYLSAIQYSFPATYMTRKECLAIESKSHPIFLNTLGYAKTFPYAMQVAPKKAGGVGLHSIYPEQGASHVNKVLLPQGRKDSRTLSSTLKVAYKWHHLYLGMKQHPFSTGQPAATHVPDGWIGNTQTFLSDSGMTVYWSGMKDIPSRKQHDRCIMDHDATKWTRHQLGVPRY
jgi:hypothetical protein